MIFIRDSLSKLNKNKLFTTLSLCATTLCFSSVSASDIGLKNQVSFEQIGITSNEFCFKKYENAKAKHSWMNEDKFKNTLSVEQDILRNISSSYAERQRQEQSFIDNIVSAYSDEKSELYFSLINGYMLWKGACLKTFSAGHNISPAEDVFNKIRDRLIISNLRMKEILNKNKNMILNDYLCYSTHTGFIESEEISNKQNKILGDRDDADAHANLSCVDVFISEMHGKITKLLYADTKTTRNIMDFLGEDRSQRVSVIMNIIRRGDSSEVADVLFAYGKYALLGRKKPERSDNKYDENLLFEEAFELLVSNFVSSFCKVNLPSDVHTRIMPQNIFNHQIANNLLSGMFSVSVKGVEASGFLCTESGLLEQCQDEIIVQKMTEWLNGLIEMGQKSKERVRNEILLKIWSIDDEILTTVPFGLSCDEDINPRLVLNCLLKKHCLYELLKSVKI